jgi:nucleoside 2-deoxyribosyltransferase
MSGAEIGPFIGKLYSYGFRQYEQVWGDDQVRSAYLAGPMRGYEDYNYPLFNAVAKELRETGYKISNPAETDAEVAERAEVADNPLSVYMERDLADVARTDAVFVLPGWEASQGAMIEVTVAQMLGHPVYSLPTYDRVDWHASETTQETLPTGSEARKNIPITTGVLDYFPAAIAEVAKVSKAGNDKHNPGEPMHHARSKSMDQADCIARHLLERGGIDPETGQRHSAQLAWRALAMLQIELEEAGEAPLARGAKP